MLIVLGVIVWGVISAVSEGSSRSPGALCSHCGGSGSVYKRYGLHERCTSPNGRHWL